MNKASKEKMMRFVIAQIAIFFIAVFVVVVLLCTGVIGTDTHERDLESEIIRRALNELDIQSYNVRLELVNKESPEWLEWQVWNYIMRVENRAFKVSVQRNENEIHLVDVITEI